MFGKVIIRNKSKLITNQPQIEKKIQIIKTVNYENKSLFGAVNVHVKKVENQENSKSVKTLKADEYKSEIYWLTQHDPKLQLKQVKKTNKIKLNLPDSLTKLIKQPLPKPQLRLKTKNADNTVQNINEIPFSDQQLKQILNFPLYHRTELDFISDNNTNFVEISKFPSVGKILQSTMSEPARNALIKWKTIKIAELGEIGFNELQANYLKTGQLFHSSIQNYFNNKEQPNQDSVIFETWRSVSPLLTQIQKPVIVETAVHHPILKYKGIVDCVVQIDNDIRIIEWKKSDRNKGKLEYTYDAPLQLCAYLGAINYDENINLQIKKGAVVIAYTNGKPADYFKLEANVLRKYWCAWLGRVQEYWIKYRDNTLPEPI